MLTAQDHFKGMLRDHLAPAMRNAGLRGSGQSYTLPSESHWAVVGIQKSMSSDAAVVKFTLNLKVVRKDIWHEQRTRFISGLPEKPSATTDYGDFEWSRRIGHLVPGAGDLWWSLTPQDAPEHVARVVVQAFVTYGLPAMHEQISGKAEAVPLGWS